MVKEKTIREEINDIAPGKLEKFPVKNTSGIRQAIYFSSDKEFRTWKKEGYIFVYRVN